MTAAPSFEPTARRSFRSVVRMLWTYPVVASVLLAAAVGAFVASVPAGFGLDEAHHIDRAWQVSRGVLEPETLTPNLQYGGKVPTALVDYVEELGGASNAGRESGRPLWERDDLALAPDAAELGRARLSAASPTTTLDFTNAGAASFVAYAAPALGMRLATTADLDVHGVLTAAKIANGALFVAMVACAFVVARRSPYRWLLLVVALLPETVFQASIVTADTFTNASALLFVAGVLALRGAQRPAWLTVAATVAAGLGMVAAKPTSLLLAGLLLTVPLAATGGRRAVGWAVRLGGPALIALGAAFFTARTSGIADGIRGQVVGWPSIDRHLQLDGLLEHPLRVVGVLARTVVTFGSSWVEGAIGLLGSNSVFLPEPFVTAVLVLLVLAALRGPRARGAGVVFVLSALAGVAAVIVALYLTFNPVSAPIASGVQGRYWIPLLVPLLAGVGMLLPVRVRMSDRVAAVTFTAVPALVLVVALVVWRLTLS
ncbi:DUF2142 domain-containing protein [Curtobacterium sp. Csp1]|uniref:DUF2142 domain-containing protein n=1 Tax=unclassified Curtobacterium TaxID=257496 RepID=UPI00159A42EB|nr:MULTISPECIES: DUF2142 domain-containing protein [unclassified Curtobacterium]QKS13869.1 DUF2142 domain-containing protein [Curtobacterium sp. csp3]QKS20913.1 DUF2142 domain-containing protein [Curtobacterium sp. Csp1]